ncbi:hypothetical protein BJX61DRAFT_16161 [Aspergillus egyptiacus]|nr:hypothetical protein BJX61DRAFT_16161 [Aspergillus egyptiacus]
MPHIMDEDMSEALRHLTYVYHYLGNHGQPGASNKIARLSIAIADVYTDAISCITSGEDNVNDVVMPNSGRHMVPSQAAPVNMAHQQAVEARMSDKVTASNESQALQSVSAPQGTINSQNGGLQAGILQTDTLESDTHQAVTIPSSTLQPGNIQPRDPQSGSWAQIASSVTPGPSGEGVQLMTPISQISFAASKEGQNSDGGGYRESAGELNVALSPAVSPEIPAEKAGIIRVYGKVTKGNTFPLTSKIHEGPLQEIRIETNGRMRIVFQYAAHALAFLKSDRDTQSGGNGRLGSGYRAELAEIMDWNEDLRRMNQPIRERRRLSWARKRLFTDNLSRRRWEQDVYTIAGPGTVELIWTYNSGNATAVFTSTVVARRVLEVFNKWKETRMVYRDVSVTYSSDPCEKEMTLYSDFNDNHNGRSHPGRYMARRALH